MLALSCMVAFGGERVRWQGRVLMGSVPEEASTPRWDLGPHSAKALPNATFTDALCSSQRNSERILVSSSCIFQSAREARVTTGAIVLQSSRLSSALLCWPLVFFHDSPSPGALCYIV